jgi:hypothetical protein
MQGFFDGRYWARTSDPQLVERGETIVVGRHLASSED